MAFPATRLFTMTLNVSAGWADAPTDQTSTTAAATWLLIATWSLLRALGPRRKPSCRRRDGCRAASALPGAESRPHNGLRAIRLGGGAHALRFPGLPSGKPDGADPPAEPQPEGLPAGSQRHQHHGREEH